MRTLPSTAQAYGLSAFRFVRSYRHHQHAGRVGVPFSPGHAGRVRSGAGAEPTTTMGRRDFTYMLMERPGLLCLPSAAGGRPPVKSATVGALHVAQARLRFQRCTDPVRGATYWVRLVELVAGAPEVIARIRQTPGALPNRCSQFQQTIKDGLSTRLEPAPTCSAPSSSRTAGRRNTKGSAAQCLRACCTMRSTAPAMA